MFTQPENKQAMDFMWFNLGKWGIINKNIKYCEWHSNFDW